MAGITTDSSYGYTQKNPIKVGGVNHDRGPLNEHTYLRNLSGANGEAISYWRLGSCCNFKTPNGIFGGGLLDIYRVARAGVQDTVVLYINMYDADTVWAPIGFQFK
ncbi:2-dehydro-3-deoxyphosphooctonate aldolase [bacterium]|nr:2-dehydro-3-deoxyphosphooctonate aldolase [bacterium]